MVEQKVRYIQIELDLLTAVPYTLTCFMCILVSTEEMLDSENQRMTESLAGKVSQLKSVRPHFRY